MVAEGCTEHDIVRRRRVKRALEVRVGHSIPSSVPLPCVGAGIEGAKTPTSIRGDSRPLEGSWLSKGAMA